MGLLNGKIAVVTGGTSGIGEATARAIVDEGGKVVIIGRNDEKGQAIIEELNINEEKAFYLHCDVSDSSSVEKMSNQLRNRFDHIDILFNNSGTIMPSMEIEKMPIDEWKKTFEVNMDGVFFVTRILKDLIVKCKGCIVNNASIAGLHSYVIGRSYAYSASKAAVIQFTRQMAKNYGEEGVRVNCICPGIIDTPILGDRDKSEYAKRVPMGYIAGPSEVAKVVVFLVSDYACYVTGAVLPVDGGVSL